MRRLRLFLVEQIGVSESADGYGSGELGDGRGQADQRGVGGGVAFADVDGQAGQLGAALGQGVEDLSAVPFVVRLDGTNGEEARQMLADAALPNVYSESTMDGAAARVVELAANPTPA